MFQSALVSALFPDLCVAGECWLCPAGHFCGSEGLVEPSGLCAAGFLCLVGATVPNPTDNTTGSSCPPGAYCQLGIKAGNWSMCFTEKHNENPFFIHFILSCALLMCFFFFQVSTVHMCFHDFKCVMFIASHINPFLPSENLSLKYF